MKGRFNRNFAINGDYLPIIRYDELHGRYAASHFGQHHANQPARYSQDFPYDRQLMIHDLGDDVHPVRHMRYTESKIVRPLLKAQNSAGEERFDFDQIMHIRLAALFHDFGECVHPEIQDATGLLVGDISYRLKTETDGSNERFIRKFIYDQLFPDIPESVLSETDDIIDYKTGSLPRETFNTSERLGYYKTGIKAGEVALKLVEVQLDGLDNRTLQLGRLAVTVSANHQPFLEERSDRFPYLKQVLQATSPTYERIHSQLSSMLTY